MRQVRRGLCMFGAAAAVMLVLGVSAAEAQGVAAADAQEFIGKWTITLEPPQGGAFAGAGGGGGAARAGGGGGGGGGRMGGPMVVEITDADGRLAASTTGGMGGPQNIRSISKSGQSLVLSYEVSGMGQTIPVTMRLTPASEKMNASLDFAGMMELSGTAAKE